MSFGLWVWGNCEKCIKVEQVDGARSSIVI